MYILLNLFISITLLPNTLSTILSSLWSTCLVFLEFIIFWLSGVSGVYPCSQTSRLFSHEYDVDIPIKQARDLIVSLFMCFSM